MLKRLLGSDERSGLIEAAFEDVSNMFRQAARMMDYSLEALLDNAELEVDLDSMDDVVDEGERMVRRTILQHLSVNPQQDLVASLILVSMVQDAERIGDFARGLSEIAPLARKPRVGPFADELRGFAQQIRPMFEVCERAFREDDVELAQQVIATQKELRPQLIGFTKRVAASDLSADMAVVYAAAAKIFRRITSHMSNIASTVVQPFDRMRHGDEDA